MKLLGFAGTPSEGTVTQSWQRYLSLLGHQPRLTTLPDGSFAGVVAAPEVAEDQGVLAIVKGELRAKGSHLAVTNPARVVAAAYRERGDDFLQGLTGSFAIVVIEPQRRRVLMAIDRMGIERLAFRVSGSTIGFGTSAEELAGAPGERFALNNQALYDFLLLHMVPAPGTIFSGVQKLRPGTVVTFEAGKLHTRTYWQPQFVEGASRESFEDWKRELHESLAAAVRDCRPDEHTGSFLSGGLDSSTVTGVLAKVGPNRARTFSIGFGVEAYNELNYARIASNHFGCDAFEYHVTADDVVTAFPVIARAYDEPFGNSSAVPTYFCALRARERGVTHLLAGDGGDEIFGGNERYVRQAIFERYTQVPPLLRRKVIEPLATLIPANIPLMPLRKLRSYVEQARIPLPERLESWNFIYQTGQSRMLEPEFERGIDPRAPLEVMREVYESAPAPTMLHKMLYYDWHFTLSDNDLRKVGSMCETAGVKVSYPMLDQRLVDLSVRIPPNRKIEGGQLRSFFKKAMRGFLPEEILTKPKHGFGLPFGEWLKTHAPLRELIYSHLHALKQRRIVRSVFLDELIEQHQHGHASYFGYAIWDLAMLEAWLQAHERR